ncbi:hypothetical protein EW145_g5261 [Phellinidium pouzarii]|uniref:Arf-GAP domain-containing protein n=1 Tax=Phellinidium pouzarii TaxID=167371 RepID=A0A4S4L2H7_9AGAM|nr:hypothetical protein EW145_g5261 [Phellinidium pouzarii]
MGTHISKVKSVDLDTWTPEQMESIQRWGNHRANLYWEAHLRPGHSPPDHKIDAFIRSKYESRRWARDGPPPADPSVLEANVATEDQVAGVSPPAPAPDPAPPAVTSPSDASFSQATRQSYRLLSASTAGRAQPAQPVQVTATVPETLKQAPQPQPKLQDDLFSLDFHAPSPPSGQQQQTTTVPPSGTNIGQYNAQPVVQDPFAQWGQPQVHAQQPQQPQATSMIGSGGTSMWGAQSGWAAAPPVAQPNVWGSFQDATSSAPAATPSTQGLFETQNIWNSSTGGAQASEGTIDIFGSIASTGTIAPVSSTQKKDDAFGDLWGDFK